MKGGDATLLQLCCHGSGATALYNVKGILPWDQVSKTATALCMETISASQSR